jgi:hypothetical protein
MRKRTLISLLTALAVLAVLGISFYLRAKAPPEAARLLPESDAIVYIHLKPLRTATNFDRIPVARSADFQRFIDATGIVPERDLDAVAFALHRMADPRGPNGPVAYSEVFVGRFDGERLAHYLLSIAATHEDYAGRTIYTVPIENRQLRIVQLSYDMIAASNMPTSEQIHSIIDRSRASALSSPGSSLLAARYHEVPQLPLPAQAWGIGHIGLPFSEDGHITVMGLELPLREDTDLVASLRYTGALHLRIEEIAPNAGSAHHTVETVSTLLNILRGIGTAAPAKDAGGIAMRGILNSATLEQHNDHAVLNATATNEQMKAIASSRSTTTDSDATPAPQPASK